MKLFGYEMDEIDEINEIEDEQISDGLNKINIEPIDKISILFSPSYYSNIYEKLNYLNNKNTFKIITNSNVTQKELFEFFNNNILEMPKGKFKDKKYTNYSIVFYTDEKNIVNKRIESNVIILADEYEKSHEISEKYNKIPGY